MLQKERKLLCYILVWLLLLAGMYTSFEKVNSMAVHTVSNHKITIQKPDEKTTCKMVYIVERTGSVLREVVGRGMSRNQSLRGNMRLLTIFLYALCVLFFDLKYQVIEEFFDLREKRYRKAIIKYIHDLDGKKRMSCLI